MFSALPFSKKTEVIYMKCFELHIRKGYLKYFIIVLKSYIVLGELSRIVVCAVDVCNISCQNCGQK